MGVGCIWDLDKEIFMNSEDTINQIADEWELPVEQVALIWSVAEWYLHGCPVDVLEVSVLRFLEERMK